MFIQIIDNKNNVININVDHIEYFQKEGDFVFKDKELGNVRDNRPFFLQDEWDERSDIEDAVKRWPEDQRFQNALLVWDRWEKTPCKKVTLHFPTRKLVFKGQEADELIRLLEKTGIYAES